MNDAAEQNDPREVAVGYHQRTKHHPQRLAPSLGYLDWALQPDPFRRFAGATLIELPRGESDDAGPAYEALYSGGGSAPQPLGQESIASFLYFALAVSAWKQAGPSTWALRVNPSSGNLHPTEGYLVLPAVDEIAEQSGLYHYAPREHGLERRASFNAWLEDGGGPRFLLALTSIAWRESWKYGERAYRYCQHDAGHALAAARFAAAMHGWSVRMLPETGDATIARLLGLDRDDADHEGERETPDMLLLVGCDPGGQTPAANVDDAFVEAVAAGEWHGHANRLSTEHHDWPAIDVAERTCRKGPGWPDDLDAITAETSAPPDAPSGFTAGRIIRQRRSAVAMDGRSSLSRDRLLTMLRRACPALAACPWDALPCPPLVDLGLFVHRIDGLDPGLYALVRNPDHQDELRGAMRDDFEWARPDGAPDDLPLYRLLAGDARQVATQVSCGQDIAGDGAVAFTMLGRFSPTILDRGPASYRHLHWETGAIGQVLYLEAEAAGLRATGIGCFFDDLVHELFGLADQTFQSIYHFTIGGPVDDPRLSTRPAYPPPST